MCLNWHGKRRLRRTLQGAALSILWMPAHGSRLDVQQAATTASTSCRSPYLCLMGRCCAKSAPRSTQADTTALPTKDASKAGCATRLKGAAQCAHRVVTTTADDNAAASALCGPQGLALLRRYGASKGQALTHKVQSKSRR